jgi:GNAT superfamily N-acetyltransferase
MKFQIRQAKPTDAPAICALLRAVTPLIVPDPTDPEALRFLESFKEPAVVERLAAPNYFHLVAERGADFFGYIATRDGTHLYHLFVQPELHGQGIGRQLWQQLLRVSGPGPYTVNSSVPAVAVYRSFVPSGEPQLHRCPPYVPMTYAGGC